MWSSPSLNLHSSEDRQSKNTLLSNVLGSMKGFEENESTIKGRGEWRRG